MMFQYASKNCYIEKTNSITKKIIANKKVFSEIDSACFEQLNNISKLPNIYPEVIGLSDLHIGYGVPIGSVFASPVDAGIISPEAVGFDIGCGVSFIKTNLYKKDLDLVSLKKIAKAFEKLPLGLSTKGYVLSKSDFSKILETGVSWSIENNFLNKKDLKNIEYKGYFDKANTKHLSKESKARGITEIGTLGQGNHFIDLLLVENVFNKAYLKKQKLEKEQYVIMLHSGSRGFGHQIASEFSKGFKYKDPIAYDYFNSKASQAYFESMSCAANFAFVNRSVLSYYVREAIVNTLDLKDLRFNLISDSIHNVATIEKHKNQQMIVHRKGASRAYLNRPIILPGSMQAKTYILEPTKKISETLNSVAHGSGRRLSRKNAKSEISITNLQKNLLNDDIILSGRSENLMREEQPNAYKDSLSVVESMQGFGLVKKSAALKPKLVITG